MVKTIKTNLQVSMNNTVLMTMTNTFQDLLYTMTAKQNKFTVARRKKKYFNFKKQKIDISLKSDIARTHKNIFLECNTVIKI